MIKRMLAPLAFLVILTGLFGCGGARTAPPATLPSPTAPPASPAIAMPAATTASATAPTTAGGRAEQPPAGIVDPANHGWPRQVRAADGTVVTVPAKPQRIHTLSLGYDELTMELVGPERFAAIGKAALNPMYGNIATAASRVRLAIGRDTEEILAARPDLVLASPFAKKELLEQLQQTGVTVVVSDLQDSIDGHVDNIRFLAYLYGEEERGEALVAQVRQRLARLEQLVAAQAAGTGSARPRVIRLTNKLNTPGRDTTMDGIIQRAGGINVAATAGIERWQQISLEKVVELRPDVIVFGDYDASQQDFQAELLQHPSLKNVPAVVNRRVFQLPHRYMSTLSHWNVRGAEELARLLWPEGLKDVQFTDFE